MAPSEEQPKRPTLGRHALPGSYSLNDHQEYRSHQSGPPTSIDGVMEDATGLPAASMSQLTLTNRKLHSPIAIPPPSPSLVKDSGIVHTLSHTNCVPHSKDASRIVATIFYNSSSPRHPHIHPDQSSFAKPIDHLPVPTIATGSAPTTDISDYPLEPPAPEPEPLDHLYGAHVSESCLTHFLYYLDSLLAHNQSDSRRLTSSHRCLAPDSNRPRIVEITFSPPPNPEYLSFADLCKHESIYNFEREWNCEVILQPDTVFRRHKRLCVFDMDSTLIEQEVIDEIAAYIGVQREVCEITARAMNGELDFAASLKARVALLKGVPSDVFERLKLKVTITPGAIEFCKVLKRLGFSLAVLSGGFQPLADWLAQQLCLDHAFANHLISDPETKTLTGELDPAYPIVDGTHKRNLLLSLANGKGIPLQQVMAIGDGANDIPMLQTAGLGVAWKAKSKVQLEAPARLNAGESMLDLAYLLGLTKSDIDELLA
jgi:phosphoserine phosphatase